MPPSVYLADYREELREVGLDNFIRAHFHPVLIVVGCVGTLKARSGAGGTVVAQQTDTVLMGTLAGRVFPLAKERYSAPGPILVGRTADNDVAIPEYSISRRHCQILVVGRDVRITDCGSTNGTLVNGVPLVPRKPHVLAGGDKLQLGRFALAFHHPRGFAAHLVEAA